MIYYLYQEKKNSIDIFGYQFYYYLFLSISILLSILSIIKYIL